MRIAMAESSSLNSTASNTAQKPALLDGDKVSHQGTSSHQLPRTFESQSAPPNEPSINASFLEFTTINELGLVELDIDKLERKFWTLKKDETTANEPSQEDRNVKLLRERITNFFKVLEEQEISLQLTEEEKVLPPENESVENLTEQEKSVDPENERVENLTEQEKSVDPENERVKNLTEQTEQGKSVDPKKKGVLKLTKFEYEKKNKLWNRKPDIRLMCKEYYKSKFGSIEFTEEALDNFSKCLLKAVESDLHPAVNILRRIAYPKLCEKHFSPDFAYGVFSEENSSDAKDINISMDHFEFCHEELTMNFLELFQREDFDSIAVDWEKNPEINNFLPSFGKFLVSDQNFEYPQRCFTLILAILKNPYRKFEFIYDNKLPVVKEQTTIAEYLVTCLCCPKILADKEHSEKLTETIVNFASIHNSFLAKILTGLTDLLSMPEEKHFNIEHTDQIYCRVLSIMTSIRGTILPLCLPQYFKAIACVAARDKSSELYFYLLKACEILIADAIKNESHAGVESSDPKEKDPNEKDINLFYFHCYNHFQHTLSNRLIPVFEKYQMRKNREERYLYKKHSIRATKFGYMDTEMRFLFNKCRKEAESFNIPRVKECSFNSAGKVLSLNAQFGYLNHEGKSELSGDDLEYWNSIQYFL